jgi:hypothetical protein
VTAAEIRRWRERAEKLRQTAREMLSEATWRDEVANEAERRLQAVPRRGKMGRMDGVAGQDSRRLKIAKSRTAKGRNPALQALYDAGLTPQEAAEICGTSRDVLKQCWARGGQFREIRPEWRAKLAARGVPSTVWPIKG